MCIKQGTDKRLDPCWVSTLDHQIKLLLILPLTELQDSMNESLE